MLRLAVMEGRWFSDKNVSVKGLFDLLSDIHEDTPHGFRYEMFNNGDAFKEIVLRVGLNHDIHNLYIASHGNEGCIFGSNGESISRAIIRTALRSVANTPGSYLNGVYFGACKFVDDELANFILGDEENVAIKWIAGYSETVDWVNSSALDWCFWNQFINNLDGGAVISQIDKTVKYVQDNLGGLSKSLGFKVYRRKGTSVIQLI